MIDINRPLRFVSKTDKREVTLVGVMPDGAIVATSHYNDGKPWAEPLVFDPISGVSRSSSTNLTIENAPKITSGFYPLRKHGGNGYEPYGRGMIGLSFVWSDYGDPYALEIIHTDGKPTEAKIHARP